VKAEILSVMSRKVAELVKVVKIENVVGLSILAAKERFSGYQVVEVGSW
jgi:hypothetical protein